MACQIHNKRSSKGTHSNYFGISTAACKKVNGKSNNTFPNQRIFSSWGKTSNDVCEITAENLQGKKHVFLNLDKPLKHKSCKKHNKNKKSTIYNCQLNCHCAYLTCKECSTDQEYCENTTGSSDEVSALKTSECNTKNCLNDANCTEVTIESNSSIPFLGCKSGHCHADNEKITKSNGVLAHTEYKYCHSNSDNAEDARKSKSSLPHTDCKYCRNNGDNIAEVIKSKSSLPHTDCKYCQNNIESKAELESKNALPHTNCKYCLSNINNYEELTPSEISSINSSEEEISDELLNVCSSTGYSGVPCSLHKPYSILDPINLYDSYCKLHHRRPTSHICRFCEYPEHCLVNNDISSRLREYMSGRYSQSLHEFNIQNEEKSVKFKPCEFCLKNSGNPVIYNSHQFRNSVGTITCPILKHTHHECEAAGNVQSCSEMPLKETVNCHVPSTLLDLHNISSDLYSPGSSLEVPCSYSHLNMFNLHGNRQSSTNFNNSFYSMNRHFDDKCTLDFNINLPTHNQYDTKSSFTKYNQNYSSKPKHQNNSTITGKLKKSVSCQFCLTTGKPPHIYNSHELRDESGAHINCPILKEHVINDTTGNMINTCNGSLYNAPLIQKMSCDTPHKCQYFDFLNHLVRY